MQLALFMKLARFAREVIFVGDVKQSIYGFRGSDPELVHRTLDALRERGCSLEVLGSSWRSRPPLVRYLNTVFTAAFNRDGIDRALVELAPEREEMHGAPAVVRWTLPKAKAAEQADALASAIAGLIESHQTVNDPETRETRAVSFGDVAVLAATNDHVEAIAGALRERRVPMKMTLSGLLEVPEVCLRKGLPASPRRSLGHPRHGRDPGARRLRGAGALACRSAAVARGWRGRPALGRRRRPDRLADRAVARAHGHALPGRNRRPGAQLRRRPAHRDRLGTGRDQGRPAPAQPRCISQARRDVRESLRHPARGSDPDRLPLLARAPVVSGARSPAGGDRWRRRARPDLPPREGSRMARRGRDRLPLHMAVTHLGRTFPVGHRAIGRRQSPRGTEHSLLP